MTEGFGVEASASLSLLGRSAAQLAAAAASLAAADGATRFIKPPAAVGVMPATGALILNLGGPATGYEWTVRRITVSDATAITNSLAGPAYVYAGAIVGGRGPNLDLVEPENLEWIITPLPNVANFGSDQLVLQYGEQLTVQITGATAGQQVKAAVAYQLYRPQTGAAAVQV